VWPVLISGLSSYSKAPKFPYTARVDLDDGQTTKRISLRIHTHTAGDLLGRPKRNLT
jgi:hypothetical protein